jgi:ubiquinone biosynthesis protein
VFARFDAEPLAAASIAQVHRARLQDGTEVVVKIRRPGIRRHDRGRPAPARPPGRGGRGECPRSSPTGRNSWCASSRARCGASWTWPPNAATPSASPRNLATLPFVVIPRVHWAWTPERVNVQDFVAGIPGKTWTACREGLDRAAGPRGAQAVLKMIVEDGFFHADPHPGNVFYLPGNRIAFIDFGMVGRLSPAPARGAAATAAGPGGTPPAGGGRRAAGLDRRRHRGARRRSWKTEIEAFVDQYHGTPLAELHLGEMLADVTAILREHRLALPADLALLIKAFISLEGMGRGLDPGFHMAAEALPCCARWCARATAAGPGAARLAGLRAHGWPGWPTAAARPVAPAAQRAPRPGAGGAWRLPTSSAWATRSTAPPTGWRSRW